MNPVAICLDLLLITLLLLAVWIGVRLEKRLKALRGSQEGFVGAVAELNAGADKAHAGLAELKAATLEARTELADRIQDAKGMTARIERQAAAAEQAAKRLEELIERASNLRPQLPAARDFKSSAHPGEGRDPGSFRSDPRATAPPARAEEPLTLRRQALARPSEKSLGPGLRRDERNLEGSRPRDNDRSKTRIDDDLFERPLSILGGRR